LTSEATRHRNIYAAYTNARRLATQPDEPHWMIAFGPGSLRKWYDARADFSKIISAVYKEIITVHSATLITTGWLGYPMPDVPYDISDTVSNYIDNFADGIDHLLMRYPKAQFIFVCHSLMGFIALYWCVRTSERALTDPVAQFNLNRVKTLITVNSPLQGSNDFEAMWDNFRTRYKVDTLFKNNPTPPHVFASLAIDSDIVNRIKNCTQSPLNRVVTVETLEDELIDPQITSVRWQAGHDTIQAEEAKGEDGPNIHTKALRTDSLIKRIVQEICQTIGINC